MSLSSLSRSSSLQGKLGNVSGTSSATVGGAVPATKGSPNFIFVASRRRPFLNSHITLCHPAHPAKRLGALPTGSAHGPPRRQRRSTKATLLGAP